MQQTNRKDGTMLNIYLTNLGKYNEGELVGEWVELPVSDEELEEVKKRIGINKQYEEMFITDYETDIIGVEVSEYSSVSSLIEIAEIFDRLDTSDALAFQAFLVEGVAYEDAIEMVENGDFMIYSDCQSMTDVAYEVVKESGFLDQVPEQFARYFDYESYGRDLGFEGCFHFFDNDCVELLR